MRTEACGNCGKTAKVVRKNYEFGEMGIPVELQRINVIDCPHCGNVDPIIPNLDGLMHVLALGIVCNPCKLHGEEVRFLRKYVNKSGREFSRFLHIDHTHLSKIENGKYEIGKEMDKLVRLMVVNMSSELKDGIKDLMELMPNISDDCSDTQQHIQIDPSNLTHQYA
jgi:transcriptional regulator with XRE-family HTH domain